LPDFGEKPARDPTKSGKRAITPAERGCGILFSSARVTAAHRTRATGTPVFEDPESPVPDRFTIVPDDYHVPYAGVAGDGRLFFIGHLLFVPGNRGQGDGNEFVATFLWTPDGEFDAIRVDALGARETLEPRDRDAAIEAHLAELGDYELESIDVSPFAVEAHGATFGFVPTIDDDYVSIDLHPGDYVSYTPPWDGGYDT
jgi:hypothetical protein